MAGHLHTMITIRVLDILPPNGLLVSWREPGLCNYTEQRWSLRKAQFAGTCSLSGKAIRPGDRVYRPVGSPMNRGELILAEAANQVAAIEMA